MATGYRRRTSAWASSPATMLLQLVTTLAAVPVAFVLICILQVTYILVTVPKLPEAQQDIRSSVEQTSGDSNSSKPAEYVVDMLVIGDSLAAGVGHESHKTAITGQIATQLLQQIHAYREQHTSHKRPLKTTVKWQALARTGYTASRVLSKLVPRIAWEPLDVDSSKVGTPQNTTVQTATEAVKRTNTSKPSHHRLVVISNGVNHVFRLSSLSSYKRELVQLLTAIKRSSDNDISIALIGIPDLSLFPVFAMPVRWLVGVRARQMSEATEEVVKQLSWPNLVFCSSKLSDSYGLTLTQKEWDPPGFFARDGVHAGVEGCRIVAASFVVPALAYLKYSMGLADNPSDSAKRDTKWDVQLQDRN